MHHLGWVTQPMAFALELNATCSKTSRLDSIAHAIGMCIAQVNFAAKHLKHPRSGWHGILLQLLQLSNKSLHLKLKIRLQSTAGSVTHLVLLAESVRANASETLLPDAKASSSVERATTP